MYKNQNLQILSQLFKRDLIVLRQKILTSFFDALMYSVRNIIVWGYILVGAGLSNKFGIFYFVGMLGSFSILRTMRGVNFILDDLLGPKYLLYELTLPINWSLIFIRRFLVLALETLSVSIVMIPIGSLFFLNQLKILNISYFKFVFILILINLLVSSFVLWISSWIKSSAQIGQIWMRYLHTFWLFGCLFFSWQTLYKMYPRWAYLNLLNPVTYVMEGIRSTVLGQDGFLNYWICICVIIIFTILFLSNSIYLFKKRLDLI